MKIFIGHRFVFKNDSGFVGIEFCALFKINDDIHGLSPSVNGFNVLVFYVFDHRSLL